MNDWIEKYFSLLQNEFDITKINENCYRITTHYLNSDNDCIEFYIQKDGDTIILRDDSQAIQSIEMKNGCQMTNSMRFRIKQAISCCFCFVCMEDNEFILRLPECSPQSEFGFYLHRYIQALIIVHFLCSASSFS